MPRLVKLRKKETFLRKVNICVIMLTNVLDFSFKNYYTNLQISGITFQCISCFVNVFTKGNRYLKVEPYAIWQLSVAVADFTIHVCKGVCQINIQ